MENNNTSSKYSHSLLLSPQNFKKIPVKINTRIVQSKETQENESKSSKNKKKLRIKLDTNHHPFPTHAPSYSMTSFNSPSFSTSHKYYDTHSTFSGMKNLKMLTSKSTTKSTAFSRADSKYIESKIKLANILDQTKNLLNSVNEEEKQIGKLKVFQKTKYLTSLKSLQLLQEMEYNKKWKLNENEEGGETANVLVHDGYRSQPKRRSTIRNLPNVRLSLKNIHSVGVSNGGSNNSLKYLVHKTEGDKGKLVEGIKEIHENTEITFQNTKLNIPSETEQHSQSKYEKVKFTTNNNSELKNLNSLQYLDFKTTADFRKNKPNSMNNADLLIPVNHKYKYHKKFTKYEEIMKKNINSYLDYAAKIGLADNDYDYISNVDKGLTMKADIMNMNAGLMPPGNLINFNENSNLKKIKMVQPVFIKTKFKKHIIINDCEKPKTVKFKKIYPF